MSTRKLEKLVDGLRIIDDTLFRLVASDPLVCQEILQVLLNDEDLAVIEVTTQARLVSIHREVILDALCVLGDGGVCNIEVQKGDGNDDIRRVRFHASAVTMNKTPKGTDFADIPTVKVLYITEYDVFGNGQCLTKMTRCVKQGEKYVPVEDGEDIIFANATVRDGSRASELLELFLKTDEIHDERFPQLCNGFNRYKKVKGGKKAMCNAVEEYAKEYAKEEVIRAIIEVFVEEGRAKEDVLERVCAKFKISASEAEEYWEKYK